MPHMKRVTPAELAGAGTIPELVGRLKSGTQEVKEYVARMLAALATQKPESTTGMVSAGAVGPLVALVKSGNEVGQLHAASAIASIAAGNSEHQAEVVRVGGVKPLVTLLRMGSAGTQEQAASALASVSEDRAHQQRFIEAGALPPLVNLLKGGKGNTQVYAAAAVANLAADSLQNQNLVVGAGGLPLVLALLESAKDKTQVHAARATAKLCQGNRQVQEAVHEAGAIPPLLILLNGRNIEAQVHAASAVAELARDNSETQAGIAKAGGIGPLLAMLPSRNAQAQAQAAHALAQLARCDSMRALSRAGTSVASLAHICARSPTHDAMHSSNRLNRENQDSMATMDAITLLAGLISGDCGPEVQSMAAMALAEVCRDNQANQTAAADIGSVASVVVLLKHSHSGAVKAEAAGAIWALADHHKANMTSIASAGAIAPLVTLLATGSTRAQEHAANALASLSLDLVDNLTQVTALLVGLLGTGDLDAKSSAAASLWRLVKENPDSEHSIAAAGTASDLVTLLKRGSDEARGYALWSLSLSIDEGNQATVLAEGGIPRLISMLTSSDLPTREQSAAALARLAFKNADTQVAIAKTGGIEPLISMLEAEETGGVAQEFAAAALAELAMLSDNRASIVGDGGIAPLVALLRSGGDMGKRHAAAALARLARGADATQAMIAQAGAVSPLVGLLSGDRGGAAQEEAAGALYELADNAGNRVAITDCDGIGPLVSLLGNTNLQTREHAEGGLVRLSIENSNRVLIIKQLVSMLYDSGKEQAAAALANLASDSVGNRVSIVEAGGIRPLLALLENSSSKAKENAVMAIAHLAHQSEERQTAISEAGGVPLLVNVLISSSNNVKETAVAQLCSLAADAISRLCDGHSANQTEIAEAGAIQALVAMLGSPSPEMQSTSAGAIGALCRENAENQAAVARTGAIAPLCTNVREGSLETKERSAWALWALATDNAPNKATVAKLGGIEPLVGLLVSGADAATTGSSSMALASLSAKHSENRVAIAKRLVGLLGSRVAERTVRVLSAVSEMSADNSANQIAIAKAGGIAPLIQWLNGGLDRHSFSAEAQKEAASAVLAITTNNASTQVLVAKLGGIPPLIELVAKSKMETQEYAARALWHCAGNDESKVIIAESGGIPPLVTMLSVDDTHAQELAAVVIARLSRSNSTVAIAVADAGGIPALVRLVRAGSHVAMLQAAAALAEVGAVPETRDAIAQAKGMEPLVNSLSSTVPGIPEVAALALARLARDGVESGEDGGAEPEDENFEPPPMPGARRRAEIHAYGGVTRLIDMLAQRSYPGMAKKMWAMVASVMGIVGAIEAAGSETEKHTTNPNPNLNPNPNPNPNPGSEMKEYTTIGVQEQVAATLCDITYGDRAMQDAMIEHGAIPPLLSLMRMGSQLGQEYAARAIWHLCASVHNQGVVVNGGALVELVALSRTGSEKAQELSAAVISDLARGAIVERERQMKAMGGQVRHENDSSDSAVAVPGSGADDAGGEAEPAADEAGEDAQESLSMLDHVRQALGADRLRKVIDMFRELDLDRDGSVTKEEFCTGLAERGIEDRAGLEELFLEIDRDGDGSIQYRELNRVLRAGSSITLASELQDGAMGEIEREARNPTALREDEASNEPPTEQMEGGDLSDASPAAAADRGDRLSAIAAAGGIFPLVMLLTSGSLMGKERAAGALWHLSVDTGNRMSIAKAGGIAPLVQLLDDGTLQAHIYVAEALTRLAKNNPDNQAQIAKKLVGLLSYPRAGAQQRAAHVLWELGTSNPDAPVIIVNAGAISPLVTLVSAGETEAKKEAAGALSTLASNNLQNQLAIATGLVALLGQGSAEAQEHVTLLLLTLASDADNRVAIAKAGAVQKLITQLRGGGSTSMRAQDLAAAALSYLSGDSDENVRDIHEAEGIEPLVAMLSSESVEGQAHAAAVLSDMTRVYREEVAGEGGVEALVTLLTDGTSSDIKAEAAGALWNIAAGISKMQTRVVKAGAIQPLVSLLRDPDMRTRRKAAAALTSLAVGNPTYQNAIAQAGAIPPLVELLGGEYLGEVQIYAAGALAELARRNPKIQTSIAATGCIAKLVSLLGGTSAEAVKEEAAGALWSLSARHLANQVAIAEAGGTAPLVALLSLSSARVQEQAAGALASLALNNETNQTSIARMLVDLLRPDDKVASGKAARAISRLARANPSNQEAIAAAGGIPLLVSLLNADNSRPTGLLGRSKGAEVQREMAAALWSMADDSPANQAAIAEAGGIPSLISMLTNNPDVHADAAGALWSLAAAPENQKEIAERGGIPPLVALLRTTKGAQETAGGALNSLAELPDNRVIMSDAGAVRALVSLLENGSSKGIEQAAGALVRLVVNNSVNQSAVARELVALLSGSKSRSAQENVTTVIRSLALDPENRASIASAGAIPLLGRQLRDGMETSQSMAAGALSQIALKSAALRVQVTQELVGLLGSDVFAVRTRASEALSVMNAEAGSDARMPIAMAGGIARFVALLKDGSVEAQEYALWSLWQSTDMASKVSIAEAGCTTPIINTLLKEKLNATAQEHAAAVLCELTSIVSGVDNSLRIMNSKDIVNSDGIRPLIQLLRKGSDGAKRHASLALAQLSRVDNETQEAITRSGAISAFVEWLADPSLAPPELAARALADIAHDNKDAQSNIMEEGSVPWLVGMLAPERRVEEQKYAAGALAALAQRSHLNQLTIFEEGGIAPLVALIVSGHAAPHVNATQALWHLSANGDTRLAIAREGGLVPLIKLLVDGSEVVQESASAAMESLTHDCPENQVTKAAVDAIQPLVNLLASDYEETQNHAVRALLNISSPNLENRNAVVRPLVALLQVRNATAQMKAAQALVLLASRSGANRVAIAEAGAIPPLVQLLGDGRNATTPQVRAAAVLCDLARSGENKQKIVEAGGVIPLVKMLSSHNLDAQVNSSGALWHLAANTAAQRIISEAGGIAPLVMLLSGTSLEAARYAAGTLWHLEASADNKGAIVKAGAIPPLVILLRKSESPEAQEAAALVLSDLARSQAGNKAITTAAGIPSLVAVLLNGSREAQKHAASALWGLTAGTAGAGPVSTTVEHNLQAVTQAGAIPMLVRLISRSSDTQGYAVAALNNLSLLESARSAMLEQEVVPQLRSLISGPQTWMKGQAVETLQNLGVDVEHGPAKLNVETAVAAQAGKRNSSAAVDSARPMMKFHADQPTGRRQFTAR